LCIFKNAKVKRKKNGTIKIKTNIGILKKSVTLDYCFVFWHEVILYVNAFSNSTNLRQKWLKSKFKMP